MLALMVFCGAAVAEDRVQYSLGLGVTFHVDKQNITSAEWENPEVVRLAVWSPSRKWSFGAMLVPENTRKGTRIQTGYFTAQRVLH